jgi:hypothetical protein
VEETERKIAEYKESNKDLITKNRGKLVSEIDLLFNNDFKENIQ